MGRTAPSDPVLPSRKILLVSTVGGSTNLVPVLEVSKILHERGHTIEFATLEGGQKYLVKNPWLSGVHILGRAITPEEDEELYTRASRWNFNTIAGRRDIAYVKTFLDGFWTETYFSLQKLVTKRHFDFIFADYQNDAVKDIMREHRIPLAQMWPQAPFLMVSQPWIPGQPFMQQRCLTSENASIYDRLFDSTYMLRSLPMFAYVFVWTVLMRWKAGKAMFPVQRKPDYLVFINSFPGLETPKDLPPLMSCVGPILPDIYPPLDPHSQDFLESRRKVAFIAFGTHLRLPFPIFERLVAGFVAAIASGHLEGIIWAIGREARKHYNTSLPIPSATYPKIKGFTYGDVFDNVIPNMLFVDFAPQRAVLSHPHTRLFLTHCGGNSANEGAYHGVPMLTLAINGDQLSGAMRLNFAGVAECLDKLNFTSAEMVEKIAILIEDKQGSYARNCLRLKRIARLASKGKERAADLIEEHMYDHELRHEDKGEGAGVGKELRPMHLQTADARMNWFKAGNWDIALLGLFALAFTGGIIATATMGPEAILEKLII